MKKKIICLFLLVCCVFNLSSCSFYIVHDDYGVVKKELKNCGYVVEDKEAPYGEGLISYLYASHESGDEIYVIYCFSRRVARSVHKYAMKMQAAKKSELQMEIKALEYSLYMAEDVNSQMKGEYYEEYLNKKEELKKHKEYGCGRYMNLVWYGTKQSVVDING